MKTAVGPAGPACPVCAAPQRSGPTTVYTVERTASHFIPRQRDRVQHERLVRCLRRLWQRDFIRVYECGECGFGFGDPHIGGDREFYEILHESPGYPSWRWEYGVALESAPTATQGELLALDIGAGNGAFLKHLPQGWKRYGVESTETMRGHLEREGIRVVRDLTAAAEAMPGSFHLITAFQVIEHVSDFPALLTSLRRLSAPNAALVLSMPHGPELQRRFRATRCPDMPPNHINQWTERSIALALERAGFEPPRCQREPDRWSAVPYSAYLRLRSDAAEMPWSLAGLAYRVHHRRLRGHLLRALGGIATVKMLPHLRDARRSASFVAVSRVPRGR